MSQARQSPTDGLASDAAPALSQEQIFEVLSNQRRRYAFHYLKRTDREVYLRELAERVAAWENEKPESALSSKELKRVKTALHQHHLPKMDENGFVEYDARRETVRLSAQASNLEVYLDVVPGADVPWSIYYLGLATLGVLVVAGTSLGAPVVGGVQGLSVALFFATAFLVSAAVHTYYNYARLRLGSTADPPEVRDR